MSDAPKKAPGYETEDARIQSIFWLLGGLFILLIAVLVFMAGVLHFLRERTNAPLPEAAALPAVESEPPPDPRLQVKPETDFKRFRARQDSLLHSYGWVSKEAGVVRIPVEEAMKMMLQRGFPQRPNDPEKR